MISKDLHRKYVDNLTSLSDKSGTEMREFVMKAFRSILKQSNRDPKAFVRNVRNAKPKLIRAMSKKAMTVANESFKLGKQFMSEKKK